MTICCAFYKFVKFDGVTFLPSFQNSLKYFCKSHSVYGMIILGTYLVRQHRRLDLIMHTI